MNLNAKLCARVVACAAVAFLTVIVAAPARGQQMTPRLIHYQGRLTDHADQPISSAQTLWFSLHAGGDALTSGSGTLLYRERAEITPNGNGVFDHLIGSGVAEAGAIDPADFATTQTVYIQVAVGTADRVVLPRTSFATVGYSFVAENATGDITPRSISVKGFGMVIDSQGRWVGAPLPKGDTPQISSIEDVTGGRTVPGDLLRLAGSGLAAARVEIGGHEAPIKSRAAGEIVCQIPAGLPTGPNAISVAAGPGIAAARVVGTVELTRYLVAISTAGDSAWILDPRELASDRTPLVTQIPVALGAEANHIQPGFAHNGALMLVPDNDSDKLFAIDMTRNPPALLDAAGFAAEGVGKAIAVAASPRGDLAIVADHGNNAIKAINLLQAFPPYTTQSALLANETDAAYQPPALPAGFGPRAVRFSGDGLFFVLGETSSIMAFHRRAPDETSRPGIYLDPSPGSGMSTTLPTIPGAFQLTPADNARMLITATGTATISCSYMADMWMTAKNPLTYVALGAGIIQTDVAPDCRTVLATCYSASGGSLNRLNVMRLNDRDIAQIGVVTPPATRTGVYFQAAAIEPGSGCIVAVATTDKSVFFYKLRGTTLERFGFEGPLVDGELAVGDGFDSIQTMMWQP